MYILFVVLILVYNKTHKPLKICFVMDLSEYLHRFLNFNSVQNMSHNMFHLFLFLFTVLSYIIS